MKNSYPQISETSPWSCIWNLKISESIKHFLWLILHELPTNSFRVYRHVSNDPSCQRRGYGQESLIHTLRDCFKASRVWSVLHIDQGQDFYSLDCRNRIRINASKPHGSLFVTVCWSIWKARNAKKKFC